MEGNERKPAICDGDGIIKIGCGHERLPKLNRHTIEWQSRGKNCHISRKKAQKQKAKLTTPTQQSRSTTSCVCSNPNARPAVSDNFPSHDTFLIPPSCFFSFPIPSPSFLPNAGSSKTKNHLFPFFETALLLLPLACDGDD